MRVLVACEESQAVCIAFRERGHEAFSCDLLPCSGGHPEWHLQMNAVKAMTLKEWDLVIAHPPCTRLANSGVRWLDERDLWDELEDALHLFRQFQKKGKYTRVAIENPIPHKYAVSGFHNKFGKYIEGVGHYSQIIQPWQFGHGETKATCLWLNGLPKLQPTNIVEGREGRVWKMAPSPERAKMRSKTYEGIAKAMATQWTQP